jgi:hypothetical protein
VPEFDLGVLDREHVLEEQVVALQHQLQEQAESYETRIHALEARLESREHELQAIKVLDNDPHPPRRGTSPQYIVDWRTVLTVKERGREKHFEGRSCTISLDSVTVYFDHNLYVPDTALLTIDLPAELPHQAKHPVEVEGQLVCTILACNGRGFRTEFVFKRFRPHSKTHLKHYLQRRERYLQGF